MDPQRWRQVKQLYRAALESEPNQRDTFLRKACGGDETLRKQVESLLALNPEAENFIESPALEVVAKALVQDRIDESPGDLTGRSIAHYQVISTIGSGGMGVVYRASDTKLRRDVAIKVLPAHFAHDQDRLRRFKNEAHVLATLNHPHIAAIYGIEEVDAAIALVLELVEGPTLADLLMKGPLPIAEALTLARQIAEALGAAHEKRIVHRDLKPANIKVTPSGTVKVLDFGLAKAFGIEAADQDLSQAMTLAATESRAGMIIGTAPYMSPEQSSGKPVDRRTDIWAFGCVLYEMLTAQKAFEGGTVSETLARILEREPEWTSLPLTIPSGIRIALRRCLEKDPTRRLHDIGDARIEIEDALAGRSVEAPPVAQPARRRPMLAAALAGLLLGAIGAGLLLWRPGNTAAPPPVVRFSFDLPQGQSMKPTWNAQLMFSPDSSILAYSHDVNGVETIFLRRIGDLDARPFDSAPGMSIPVFSPDGRYLLGMESMQMSLKKAALSGGAPLFFSNFDMAFRGDWASDDYYYWTSHYFGPIVRTPAAGGEQEAVTELDLKRLERTHRHVQMLPDGKAIIFTVTSGGIDSNSFDDARIDLYTLDTKRRKTLVPGGFSPRYSPSGHIIYARGGGLYAVPFDVKSKEVTGPPVPVVNNGVFMSTNSGSAHFDVSRSGALAYAVGRAEGGARTVFWVDRNGKSKPLPLPPRSYVFPRISPDGRHIAIEVEGVNHDLYTYDIERDVMTKMTTDGLSHAPVWTPDGRHLAFRSWKAGTMTMWWMPSDASGPAERLTRVGARQSAVSFSPDGRYLVFNQMEPMGMGSSSMGLMGSSGSGMEMGGMGVWVLPMQGDTTPRPFVESRFTVGSGRFSPDGKWVAYCLNESGRNEVVVQAWPGPGPRKQISSEGGTDPIWNRNGKELFYRNGDKMMVVSVVTQPVFEASRPQLLWQARFSHGMSSSCGPPGATEGNYDVSGDGQRFLMIKDLDADFTSTRIIVVLNFAEELKKLAAEQKQ